MIYLALDASTRVVGWALFRDAALLGSGVHVPEGDDWQHRILEFGFWLGEGLADRYDIQAVAYERATGDHGNIHTHRLLGALEYEAWRTVNQYEYPCQFITVTASQVQRRDYPNKNNLELARQIKGEPLDKDNPGDEADAIGAGYAAWGKIKEAAWARQASED